MVANIREWTPEVSARAVTEVEVETFEVASAQTETETTSAQFTIPFEFEESEHDRNVLRAKRAFDLAVTILLLPFVLPVMALVALAIKLDSRGSVIFHQERVGRHGQPFTCLKFRSMRIDAEEIKKNLMAENEASGPVFKMKRDPRITRVGRVIRKLSLDELPQILNVLAGEMSLVGPRPPIPAEVAKYHEWQFGRLATIPGLTGLQQVSGRSDLDFDTWVKLDLEYIENQSVKNDIVILLKTVPAVLTGKGAY